MIGNESRVPLTEKTCRAKINPSKDPSILSDPGAADLPRGKEAVRMNCRNCGAPLDEGAFFCRKCGTSVPENPVIQPKATLPSRLKGNRPALILFGAGLLVLVLALVLILSAVSCSRSRFRTPEAVTEAVLTALSKGDGERLSKLAKTSEPFLGLHPETFGTGDTPHAVMRGYYRALADSMRVNLIGRGGKRFTLGEPAETRFVSGTEIFEPNRTLGIDATQYAVTSGPLTVDGEATASIQIIAAELDGEWKLIVVYVTNVN